MQSISHVTILCISINKLDVCLTYYILIVDAL